MEITGGTITKYKIWCVKLGFIDRGMTYYSLGKWIVDVQQNGNERAEYGKHIIKNLSEKLNQEFGKGFTFVARQKRFSFE